MNDERRQHVHGMWASVADTWAANADYIETRTGDLNKTLLDGADIGAADRVLELASGPGGLGLAAAARAREVVISDVVPAMVEAARRRAEGVRNITTKVLDLEDIAEPDASFDVVLVREGLMFAVDPERAVGEMARVLRPGGRVAVSVWASKAENPWLAVVMDAVSELLGMQVPPPGMPGPFALADAARLAQLFDDFTDVEVSTAPAPLHTSSFEEWWERTRKLAGPVSGIIERLPEASQLDLVARLRDAVAPYQSANGLDLPGLTLVLTARA